MASSSSTSSGSVLLSVSEQEFIRQGCQADCRADGRAATDFRTYYIETAPVQLSHGSARLVDATGSLQMLCSVKAELVKPSSRNPAAGSIDVSVDEHAAASRRKNTLLREHQAALQQRLQWMDPEKLCVVAGAAVWRLNVDLYLLSTGNAAWLDAASHCIRVALSNTVLPALTVADDTDSKNVLDRLLVDSDIAHAKPVINLEEVPLIVTVHVIQTVNDSGRHEQQVLVLDATAEEEAVSVSAVHVAVKRLEKEAATVCAVWKSGSGSLPITLLPACVQAAISAAPVAVQHFKVQAAPTSSQHMILLQEPLCIQ